MRSELIKKINENLEGASDDLLETISRSLTNCKEREEGILSERKRLFDQAADTIIELGECVVSNSITNEIKEIGANIIYSEKETAQFMCIYDGEEIVRMALDENNKRVLEFDEKSLILQAFSELFEQMSYGDE